MATPYKFNFNVQFMCGITGHTQGWAGPLEEDNFPAVEFLMGRGIETLVKEPFAQGADWNTARGFLMLVGYKAGALQAEAESGPGIWRISVG